MSSALRNLCCPTQFRNNTWASGGGLVRQPGTWDPLLHILGGGQFCPHPFPGCCLWAQFCVRVCALSLHPSILAQPSPSRKRPRCGIGHPTGACLAPCSAEYRGSGGSTAGREEGARSNGGQRTDPPRWHPKGQVA